MKRNYFKFLSSVLAIIGLLSISCSSSDDLFERVYWKLYLNPQSQVPAVKRTEIASMAMQLLSDNTLSYNIKVSGLVAGDTLTTAYMYAGDPLTNGPVVLDFKPVFENGVALGSMILRQSLADSLLNLNNQLYVSVQSAKEPGGLLRGQVQTDVILAADVDLVGANQVPPVATTASGKALIRLSSDYKLYSNVSVVNLEATDALSMALIQSGAAGVVGDSIVILCQTAADFGLNKVNKLTVLEVEALRKQPNYVNVNSTTHPAGLVRGQLVNAATNAPASRTKR